MVKDATVAKKRVCIIGGGPTGLMSLRNVVESKNVMGTLYEQREDIGGVWNFTGEKKPRTLLENVFAGSGDKAECWASMYSNLTSNVPYMYMELKDYPQPAALLSDPVHNTFRSQQQMHQYFHGYATHFNLWSHIQINTAVTCVRPEKNVDLGPEGTPCRWSVTTHNHKDGIYNTEIYDAVMVCIGKSTYPQMPPFPGLEHFEGQVFHTKYFEKAEDVTGKDVVCVGYGPSSADMALHLSKTAKSITICHKFPDGSKFGMLPFNVREIPRLKQVTKRGIISESGEEVPCDVIVLATGYTLKFPFFTDNMEQIPQVVAGKYVPHLYNMTVFTKRPSLAILNMPLRTTEIIMAQIQARYFTAVLDGRHQLPTFEEMEKKVTLWEKEKIRQNQPYSQWFKEGRHGFGAWAYFRGIAEEAGFANEYCRDWPIMEAMLYVIFKRLFGNLTICKKDKLRIVNKNNWELLLAPELEGQNKQKQEKLVICMDPVTGKVTTDTVQLNHFDEFKLN